MNNCDPDTLPVTQLFITALNLLDITCSSHDTIFITVPPPGQNGNTDVVPQPHGLNYCRNPLV